MGLRGRQRLFPKPHVFILLPVNGLLTGIRDLSHVIHLRSLRGEDYSGGPQLFPAMRTNCDVEKGLERVGVAGSGDDKKV